MAESERVSYTMNGFYNQPPEAQLIDMRGYVEGFCKSIRVRTAQTRKGPVKVADADITAVMPDRFTERKFGKEFVNEYHSVRWKITYWGYDAENLEKYPPQKNQKILCLVDHIAVRTNTAKDGRVYRMVEANGTGTPERTSRKKEEGESALLREPAEEKVPAAETGSPDGLAFLEEDLPF